MPRQHLGINVFDMAVRRMEEVYAGGHRVIVSFSGGKDSGVCLEICLIAARLTARLPVEVMMRDEEIMFPGTFEYCERVATRSEIDFHWIYACQPVINIYNRNAPYFWVFDPLLPPEQWVRQPPARAYYITENNIEHTTTPARFPPQEGKQLFAVLGLRTSESRSRMMGLFSSGGYLTRPNKYGTFSCRPIYDWSDGDIWKAIKDNQWDYNDAYDVMARQIPMWQTAPCLVEHLGYNRSLIGINGTIAGRTRTAKWYEPEPGMIDWQTTAYQPVLDNGGSMKQYAKFLR